MLVPSLLRLLLLTGGTTPPTSNRPPRPTWWLTLYSDDDEIPVTDCSTDPDHPRPYLIAPDGGAEAEIDLLRGTSTIGQVNVRVLDKRTNPNDKRTGWLTALLADAAGESARIGRRVRLEHAESPVSDRVVVMDGVIGSMRLDERIVTYVIEARDIRERERKSRAFEVGGTSTVWPRGVLDGYGLLPNGAKMQPATTPARGTFKLAGTGWGVVKVDRSVSPKADLILTSTMREAVRPVWSAERNRFELADAALLWRPVGSSAWTRLENMEVTDPAQRAGIRGVSLFDTDPTDVRDAQGRKQEADIIDFVYLRATASGGIPANGARVELLLVHTGEPSDRFPFHFEGTAGELLRNLYRGDYSSRAPGVRYDEVALLALNTPVRLRLTAPVDDIRKWVEEHIYRPLGAAPALDADGRVSPVRYALPDVEAELVQINDANTKLGAAWVHEGSDAINRVAFTYVREQRVAADVDVLNEQSRGDGITEQEVRVETVAKDSQAFLGEQELEIKPLTIRALAGERGGPITGDVQDEAGHQLARERGEQALDRFRFGGQYVTAQCARSATATLKPGDWVLVGLSWLPEYATGIRGANRLAQVVSVRDLNPAWRVLQFVDAGPDNQPVGQPTLGALSVDDDGVVSVPVTAIPPGGEARVDYAVSPTLPPTTSGLWTYLARTAEVATVATPPLPAGATAWIRARGEAPGRRRSAWTNAVNIMVPAVPRVRRVAVGVDDDTGDAVAFWTPNSFVLGVRIYYAVHAQGAVPSLTGYIDRPASGRSAVLPVVVDPQQAITIEVEPWTGWTGTAVTGAAGRRVRGTTIRAAGDALAWTYSIYNLTRTDLDPENVQITWDQGINVAEVVPWLVEVVGSSGETTDAVAVGTARRPLTTERQLVVQRPKAGRELHGALVPYTADLRQVGEIVRFEIDAIPPRVSGRVRVVSRVGDTASLAVEIDAAASEYPLTAYVYEDDDGDDIAPPGLALVALPFEGDGVQDYTTVPQLADRPLPLREMRRWPLRVVTVSGAEYWLTPGAADRDALPDGTRVDWDDFEAQPVGYIKYDDDTDTVDVETPEGTKTYTGLSGSGLLVYVVGAVVLPSGFGETPLAVGETRPGYEVYATGGGVRTLVWSGALHGVSPVAPTVSPRVVTSADMSTATVFVRIGSPVGEAVRLEWQEAEGASAPVQVTSYVASGTEVQIPTTFNLARDTFDRIRVRARGQESGVDGTWISVPLAPKGTAYLDSADLYFNSGDGKLYLQAVGGAFCAQARFRIDDDPSFGSPLLDETLALVDGQALTRSTAPLGSAQKGKGWYGRVTPINAGGVSGNSAEDAEQVASADPLILSHSVVEKNGGSYVRVRFGATPATTFAQWSEDNATWYTVTAYNNNTVEGNFAGTYSGEVGGDIPQFQPNPAGGAPKYVYLRGLTGASEPGAVYRVEIPPRSPVATTEPTIASVTATHGQGGSCGASPMQHGITVRINNPAAGFTLRVTRFSTASGPSNDVASDVALDPDGTMEFTDFITDYANQPNNGSTGAVMEYSYHAQIEATASGKIVSGAHSNLLKRFVVACA